MNITKKHVTKKSCSSKLEEKYYINEKTHFATDQHSLKINKPEVGKKSKN